MFHHHERCIGNINAHLNDYRCYKYIQLAASKRVHGSFAIIARQLTVHNAHAQSCKYTRRQCARGSFSILETHGAFFNRGHHHVALLASINARAQVRVHLGFLVATNHPGSDWLPTGWPRSYH